MRSLRDALEEFGADRTLAETMIKGKTPQNPRNIRDLAETLRVPQRWFTEENADDLIKSDDEAFSFTDALKQPVGAGLTPAAAEQLEAALLGAVQQVRSSSQRTEEREPGAASE